MCAPSERIVIGLRLQEPFPLYPGEQLEGAPPKGSKPPPSTIIIYCPLFLPCYVTGADFSRAVKALPHVKADHGLHLRALATIDKDESGTKRTEGEEWQLRGPLAYIPCPGVVVSREQSTWKRTGFYPCDWFAGGGSCDVSPYHQSRARSATEGHSGPPDIQWGDESHWGGVAGQRCGCLPAWGF